MEKATISQLRNHLSAYLRKVRAGKVVLIFDRDEPVARLEGVPGQARPEDKLARLERAGLLQRSTQPVPTELLRKTPPKSKRSVLDALLEERLEGR